VKLEKSPHTIHSPWLQCALLLCFLQHRLLLHGVFLLSMVTVMPALVLVDLMEVAIEALHLQQLRKAQSWVPTQNKQITVVGAVKAQEVVVAVVKVGEVVAGITHQVKHHGETE